MYKSLLHILLLCSAICVITQSVKSQDSSFNQSENILIDSLLAISTGYIELNSLDSALQVLNEIESHIDQKEDRSYYAKMLFNKGYAYDINGSLDTAVQYYNKAELIFRDIGDKEEIAHCLNFKASAYYFAGEIDQAASIYLDGLNYTEEHNIRDIQLSILNNLGVIYRTSGKNADAIDIYNQTLSLSKKVSNENMIGASYHNLGIAYSFDGDKDNALIYFDSALTQYTLLEDSLEMGRTSNAIGDAYYLDGNDIVKAKAYLLQGESLLTKFNNQEALSNTYLTLGNIEKDLKSYNLAQVYYKKGLALLEGTERDEQLMDYYKALESLYSETGDKTMAYSYLTKYVTLYEDLRASEKTKIIEDIQTKYNTEKKENQIALLNSQNEIQSTKLKARRNELIVLGIGMSLLFGFSLWVYRLYQKLKIQNKVTAQALTDKDTLLREIHHRVKNNLQLVSGLLILQSEHVKDEHSINALKDSEVRVQSIALLHQDLYANDNLRDVNTKDYINRLIENLKVTFKTGDRNIKLESNIESLILDVETMIPIGLVINELVTNSLKHAFANESGGNILVTFAEANNTLVLNVKDNGQSSNSIESKEKSFGYTLIEYFAARLEGQLKVDSDNGYHVTFTIRNYNKVS